MKFNWLRFLSVVFICIACTCSQSAFARISLETPFAVISTVIVSLDKQGGTGGVDNLYRCGRKFYTSNKCDETEITTPTRDMYVFKGYYSAKTGGDLYITDNGTLTEKILSIKISKVLYAQWEKCENGTVKDNVCDKTCATDLYYDNTCVVANKYLKNSEWIDCPQPAESGYDFIKEKSDDYNIETCAIKLTGTSCGSRTKVIYRYDSDEEAYVRDNDYIVVAGKQSLLKDKTDSEYPSAIINIDDDTNKDNNTKAKDYCVPCETGQYNINGECGYCHSGYCVDTSTESCELCPAGYACRGDGDRTGVVSDSASEVIKGSLLCSAKAECGMDEYAESGSATCIHCAAGYSTYDSGPAYQTEDGIISDGTCMERANMHGTLCVSNGACKKIPEQLCYKADCSCKSGASLTGNGIIEKRENCKSSDSFGNITWGAINSKVVQTMLSGK